MFRDVTQRVSSPTLLLALALSVACTTATRGGAPSVCSSVPSLSAMLAAAPPATTPKAVLTRIDAAGAVLFRTDGSAYQAYAWAVSPKEAEANFLKLKTEDGEPIALCFYPKSFTVVLSCAAMDNGTLRIDAAVAHIDRSEPEPNPPDPDPPSPNQKWQVCFFRESSTMEELSQAQRAIVSSQVLRGELEKRGHKFVGSFDRDSLNKQNKTPTRLAPWWDAVKGDTLPRIAIAPLGGGAVRDFPLPVDMTALWKLLEEGKP